MAQEKVTNVSDIKNLIFAADDIASEDVVVPEWGSVTITLRAMSARDRADVIEHASTNGTITDLALFHALTVIYGAFDPDTGARIFVLSDVDALMQKAAGVLERIATRILTISGMTKEEQDRLGKDSSSTPTDDSSTN